MTIRENDRVSFSIRDAFVVPRFNVQRHRFTVALESFPHHRDLEISLRNTQDVKLLIGMDVQDTHLYADVRRPPLGIRGPNAILTPFGWSVVGRIQGQTSGGSINVLRINHIHIEQIRQLEDSVEWFW